MLTEREKLDVKMALHGFFGPLTLLWPYLALVLGRKLTEEDMREIRTTFLGHRD